MSEEEEQNRFSLRKLSIGLASVLVGVSIFGTSQTVKADTVADQNTSAVTSNAQSSDTQENKNVAKSSFSNDNQANNAKSNLIQTQVEGKNDQKQDSVSNTQEATDSNDLQQKDAEKSVVRTSSLQKTDNHQSNDHAEDNSQTQTSQKLDLTKNSKKLAKSVDVKALAESKVATSNQFNFDDWTTQIDDTYLNITGYKGDRSKQIVVPNGADFAKAGKNDKNLQVEIDSNTLGDLVVNGVAPKLSNTDGQKIVAKGDYWANAFDQKNLHDISGLANLDTSNVTNMSGMFQNNQISDLSPLSSWDTGNVTNMFFMFYANQINDLSPLASWNTDNVTNMESMFQNNQISNLSPLTSWNTGNVTSMSHILGNNRISDLSPLASWNIGNVTYMYGMFQNNPDLIDLSPIANWNLSSVPYYYGLFSDDTKLDLTNINNTPLMQGILKNPDALFGAIFITDNADLVKATINQDLPNLINTAKRTITFNIPNATPTTVVQIINYKAVAPVQIDYFYDANEKIVQTYPVKESDWQLDTSKQNDAIIVNGQVHFKAVKIPHVNGYKAYIVPNKSNSALFTVSFIAVPTENKPSTPVEATPSKPSAPTDNSSNSAWTNLKHKVVNTLNQSDSGWTMPENNSTYTVEVPDDAIIDLSDLVIAEPVHAQTRTQIHVTKCFKLSKKHAIKHLKHRKKAVKSFKKYRL